MTDVLSPNAKMDPYWWEAAPRPKIPEAKLPPQVDAVVIGAGYTGVSAALALAREGRETVVFDAEHAGWGCSTRNGGQIGTKLRLGIEDLAATYGRPRAIAMIKEVTNARNFIADLIQREKIDCDWNVCGRFVGAHRPGDYESLAKDLPAYQKEVGLEAEMVSRSEQHAHIGTDAYYGGQYVRNNASLDPAKFHQGMLDRAMAAGAKIVTHCPVTGVEKNGTGFLVTHAKGQIKAKNVIVATNGYTPPALADWRRRVIPIGSYIIATEKLAPGVMDRIMPKRRVISDTRRVVFYYRASPDGTRIVFGGRVASSETDCRVSAPRLHAIMTGIFPELASVKVSHSWMGFVAYTFDHLPHVGERDGIHFAMGYCGSGAHMAPYLGYKAAQKVLGRKEGDTAYDGLTFQTRPLYSGTPWFLASTVFYYKMMDRFGGQGRRP